jgi:polyisoprenoid-binding protein YceI
MVKNFIKLMVLSSVILTMATGTVSSQSLSMRTGRGISQPATAIQETATEAMYRLNSSKQTSMNLSGTTPVKNWTMTANGLSGEAKICFLKGGLVDVESLIFKLPVYNLKGEVKAMDEDAYEALKADRHKEIIFKLIDSKVSSQSNSHYLVEARGTLTVAGVTKPVTLRMNATIDRDGTVSFTGSQILKMSDYDVERPSLLFGTIKAGNEMTLTYKLNFTK